MQRANLRSCFLQEAGNCVFRVAFLFSSALLDAGWTQGRDVEYPGERATAGYSVVLVSWKRCSEKIHGVHLSRDVGSLLGRYECWLCGSTRTQPMHVRNYSLCRFPCFLSFSSKHINF